MWNINCMIIQVISGVTEVVTKGSSKNLEAIPGKCVVDLLQKTAILGTSPITWKVL